MKKISTSILILSLLFASTFALNNNFKNRLLQETTPPSSSESNPNTSNGNNNTLPPKTKRPQFISVVGRASGKAQSDQVWMRFSVFTEDDEALNTFNNTKTSLKALGFEESEFSYSGVNIFTVDDNRAQNQTDAPQINDPSQPNATSEANNATQSMMMIKSSMDVLTNKTNITTVYDTAIDSGINLIDFVNHQPSEATIQAKREELIGLAIDDAQKMAQKMAERLGFQLGSVKKIHVEDIDQGSTKQEDRFKADGDDDLYLPNEKLSQTVEIKYELISKSQ